MSYKSLKLKLRVTYCATQLTATRSLIIGQFVDTMILASTNKEVMMTHQTVSPGKCWKLFVATLNSSLRRQDVFSLSLSNSSFS